MKENLLYVLLFTVLLYSCTVDNVEDTEHIPKTDFSAYNYVLATEDASDVDITTFFTFNPEDIDPDEAYDLISRDDIFVNSNPSTSKKLYFTRRAYHYSPLSCSTHHLSTRRAPRSCFT